ncbi:MAG: C39 family peptidase, partial [Chloroflexota bacterium]
MPVIIGAVILLAIGVYYIPPVHERLAWRMDGLRTQVKYFFNPPDEAVFQPSEQKQVEAIVSATMQAFLATPTRTATPRPGPSLTPTVTTTPLPDVVMLEGVTYEHQHGRLNYCGPANFSMSLTFWGWDGDRDVIGQAVKPSDKDKNVMPYELQDYITDNVPGMTSVLRFGGEIEMIKRLVAAGFPVVVEKGIYELDLNGKFGWMGHYAFVTGYDETKQELIYQDTYQPPGAPAGPNRRISYDDFTEGWRSFNFVFVVVYPVEREAEVLSALGNWADEAWATRHALERAQAEGQSLTGIDQFFAWFNAGTSHVDLLQYADASIAYDYAFQLYADLDVDN